MLCCACEVIRSSHGLATANNATQEPPPPPLALQPTTVAVSTPGASGTRRPSSMYGNWYLNVATLHAGQLARQLLHKRVTHPRPGSMRGTGASAPSRPAEQRRYLASVAYAKA